MIPMGSIGGGINLPFGSSRSLTPFENVRFPVFHHLNLAHGTSFQRDADLDGPSGTVEDPICLDD